MDNSPNKKIFDVRRPGKTSPDTTSRPSIVTNNTVVRDPTLTNLQVPEPVLVQPQTSVNPTNPTPPQTEQTALNQRARPRKVLRNACVVLVFLVAVFMGVNLLIDAGIVKTSINPVIDLIKN